MDASPASGKDEFHSLLGPPFPPPPPLPRRWPDTGRQVDAGARGWAQSGVRGAPCPLQALGFLPARRSAAPGEEPSPGPVGSSGMSAACARLIFQKVVTTKISRQI